MRRWRQVLSSEFGNTIKFISSCTSIFYFVFFIEIWPMCSFFTHNHPLKSPLLRIRKPVRFRVRSIVMLDIISVLVTAFLVNPGLGYARLARVPSFSQFQSSNPLPFSFPHPSPGTGTVCTEKPMGRQRHMRLAPQRVRRHSHTRKEKLLNNSNLSGSYSPKESQRYCFKHWSSKSVCFESNSFTLTHYTRRWREDRKVQY